MNKQRENLQNDKENTLDIKSNAPTTPPTPPSKPAPEKEFGGRKEGLEATRYGDWELKGKCVDF